MSGGARSDGVRESFFCVRKSPLVKVRQNLMGDCRISNTGQFIQEADGGYPKKVDMPAGE